MHLYVSPLGHPPERTGGVMLILVNVDHISGEMIPHIIDGLMARGAESVHAIQSITKKGRMEYIFLVDAREEQVDTLGAFLVAEVGTIGMRVLESRHICFDYRFRQMRLTVETAQGPREAVIRVKEVLDDEGEVVSVKAEYEDLREAVVGFERAGVGISFTAVKRLVEQAALAQGDGCCRNIEVGSIGGDTDEEDSASIG
jgi:uncharacterized protein (DUF111 family)